MPTRRGCRIPHGGLKTVADTITTIEAIDNADWESLGESVANTCKSAMRSCSASCANFKIALAGWTSSDGKLSPWGRVTVGFFKKNNIKSLSSQLLSHKATFTLVMSRATL